MTTNGYNPMGWDCDEDGCFNKKKRPKLEQFAECFPGRIAMGDVDGMVELNGRFCFVEWKGGGDVTPGQHMAFQNLTLLQIGGDQRVIVFVVKGDPESMRVEAYKRYHNGECNDWGPCDLAGFKKVLRKWARWTKDSRCGSG